MTFLAQPAFLHVLQWPTLKDEFEKYATWRKHVWDDGAPYAQTRDYKFDVAAMEAKWKQHHAQAGKEVRFGFAVPMRYMDSTWARRFTHRRPSLTSSFRLAGKAPIRSSGTVH